MQILTLAYEYALQQQQQDAKIIMGGASSSSNAGIYQAALELADQGETDLHHRFKVIDQTTEENQYPKWLLKIPISVQEMLWKII